MDNTVSTDRQNGADRKLIMENSKRIRVMLYETDQAMRRSIEEVARGCNCDLIAIEASWPCALGPEDICSRMGYDPCADAIISGVPDRFTDSLAVAEAYIDRQCKVPAFALISSEWHPDQEKRAAELGIKLFYTPFPMEELREWLVAVCRIASEKKRKAAVGDNPCGA